MKTAIERLEELLEIRDHELQQANGKLEAIATKESEREWAWAVPTDFDLDPRPHLPLPRLEIRATKHYEGDSWSSTRWVYYQVRRHFLGHVCFLPMGDTVVRGGCGRDKPELHENSLPYRDGSHICHDAATMKMPAFMVIEDCSLEPMPKLSTVPAKKG